MIRGIPEVVDGSLAISPGRRLEGEVAVPGDKSISHRALLVATIGEGTMELRGLSPARDVEATLEAAKALGAAVTPAPRDSKVLLEDKTSLISHGGSQVLVEGTAWVEMRVPGRPIDVGNSGTTIRLLLGILAGSPVTAELTGDDSIRRRPMGRVVDPLRAMGANIEGEAGGDRAPLRVAGGPLVGVDHVIPVASAQVKSALLLAGLRASGSTSVSEPVSSRDHTERMLRYLGVHIDESAGRLSVKSTNISNDTLTIPGDVSSAAFLLVAAAILPGSRVVVRDVGVNPTRIGILDVLRRFGAEVDVRDHREACGEPVATVEVRAGDRRSIQLKGAGTVAVLDELPLVAVMGALADGETEVRDAAELRVKESDRISAMVEGLAAMGADIRALEDGFVVRGPARLDGAPVASHGDHRIAMAMAVAAMAASGASTIEGWGCVEVSYPGFERDLGNLVVP